jgi:PAS domain S-box-containing protein
LLGGEGRVVAYRQLTGYPVVVAVSSTEDALLANWRRDAWQIGAGAVGAVIFIAMVLYFLLRQLRVGETLAVESRHAQQQVRESEERLRGIIESAMDGIITVDDDQRILMFNTAAEHLFGCPAEQAIGGPLDRFIPQRYRAAHREHIRHFGETRVTTRTMGGKLALYGVRASGEEFPIDASISQIAIEGRKLYSVILRDITQRKAAEQALTRSHEELRELASKMHEAREAERLRVARELHDELAQWLTAIRMDISWLAARLPQDPPQLAARVEKLKGAVDTTVASVRRIASDLRPVMLDDLGLVAALENLLHELSQRTGMVVSLDAEDGGLDFGEPLTSALYRIAQEALTNVARHAEASEVQVTVAVGNDDRLVLTVRDNGKGYDVEVAERKKSYGVLGIRERAYTLGGSARIERVEAGGTLVEIVIPLARYRGRRAGRDTGIAG